MFMEVPLLKLWICIHEMVEMIWKDCAESFMEFISVTCTSSTEVFVARENGSQESQNSQNLKTDNFHPPSVSGKKNPNSETLANW